jgi:hypothetical protein
MLSVLLELIHDEKAPATARVRACHDWLDALETQATSRMSAGPGATAQRQPDEGLRRRFVADRVEVRVVVGYFKNSEHPRAGCLD